MEFQVVRTFLPRLPHLTLGGVRNHGKGRKESQRQRPEEKEKCFRTFAPAGVLSEEGKASPNVKFKVYYYYY